MLALTSLLVVLGAAPQVALSVECHAEESLCAAALEAVQAGAKAEKWANTPDAPLKLRVVVKPHVAFFELADSQGIRLITHTDVTHYRAPHTVADGLMLLSILTVATIPIAVELVPPTSRSDMEAAWTAMTRQVLKKSSGKQRGWIGPGEVRGKHWSVTVGPARVLRRPVVEELMFLDGDDDFEALAAGTPEALEAEYAARLVLPTLVSRLDSQTDAKLSDGKGTLLIQSVDGRFLPNTVVRDGEGLSWFPITIKAAAAGQPSFPLKGATRVLLPITVKRRR
ncbi:MAG: hypothetical protein AMXMBFR34_50190 [Myxococcaceae bacterium]